MGTSGRGVDVRGLRNGLCSLGGDGGGGEGRVPGLNARLGKKPEGQARKGAGWGIFCYAMPLCFGGDYDSVIFPRC